MPSPYSDDLRTKLLEAYEAGSGSLRQLAVQFRVSWGWAKKIRTQQLQTGSVLRVEQKRRGFPSRVSAADRERLGIWLRSQPDQTDEELRQRLAASGVKVCLSRVGQILREMGYRRKKSRSTPANETRRPTSGGVRSSSRRSARSRRSA